MICLTGDVHHMSMKGADQAYLRCTEVGASEIYLKITNAYGIKATLFFTGKCILEELGRIKSLLLAFSDFELGGHTYRAFKPRLIYDISNILLKTKNGPKCLQYYDIMKTTKIFRNKLNYIILSWRDHGYRHDKNTPELLKSAGIKYFSDIASPHFLKPFVKDELVHVPINVLPDHDYVYHGSRQIGSLNEDVLLKTAFQTRAMSAENWFEKVKEQIDIIVKCGGLATILAHPACMEIFDRFYTFEKLCRFLSQYKTILMRDVARELL